MSGIGVVTNPRSRRNRRNPQLQEQLAYVLGEREGMAAPTDLDALERAVERFRARGIEVLAINGGDGTNHAVLSALVRVYGDRPLPRIALLRGGTMNTVASGLGIRGRPDDLLGRLVAAYHAGQPLRVAERNLLIANGQHAGFLFGNGVIARFMEEYYSRPEPTPAWAAWTLARAAASALTGGTLARRLVEPVRAAVHLDGQLWPELPWICLAAGTVDDLGFRFRPFFRSLQHPGHLHAVGFACTAGDLVRALWPIRRAQPIDNPRILEAVAQTLRVESEEPLSYMIDGDFHPGTTTLELRVGPRLQMVLL